MTTKEIKESVNKESGIYTYTDGIVTLESKNQHKICEKSGKIGELTFRFHFDLSQMVAICKFLEIKIYDKSETEMALLKKVGYVFPKVEEIKAQPNTTDLKRIAIEKAIIKALESGKTEETIKANMLKSGLTKTEVESYFKPKAKKENFDFSF